MATRRLLDAELPPTAGLPPCWRDLLPAAAATDLADGLARFLETTTVQLECSGTASLVVALTTLHGISGRRVVVVPAYTCPLVAIAVAHCGLELRLCDLAHGSIDFDIEALARLCDGDTLAIVPTHLAGRVADVDSAIARARRVGAYVIEDAAQALGARSGGRRVGFAGDIGFFSLAVGKGLTTFEGGVLVARDEVMRRELALTSARIAPRRFGWELKRSLELLAYHVAYRPALLGLAYGAGLRSALRRGDPVAAVGDDFDLSIPLHTLGRWRRSVAAHALPRLPAFLDEARARAAARVPTLAAIGGVRVIGDRGGAQGTWPFLILQLQSEATRDAILDRLWSAGVGVSRLFIHALPDYDYLATVAGSADVPNARHFAATTLTLTNSPWLDDGAFDRVCAQIAAIVDARAD